MSDGWRFIVFIAVIIFVIALMMAWGVYLNRVKDQKLKTFKHQHCYEKIEGFAYNYQTDSIIIVNAGFYCSCGLTEIFKKENYNPDSVWLPTQHGKAPVRSESGR